MARNRVGGETMGRSTAAVMRVIIVVAAGVLSACSPSATAPTPGVQRAGVVIVHSDGSVRKACVRFTEPQLSGEVLLQRSGFSPIVDASNPMGALVCSIDGQGCKFPSEPCFCACAKLGACAYWAYFTRDAAGTWSYAPQGASLRSVKDGDLDGWVWLQTSSAAAPTQSALPAIHFVDVCPAP